MYRMEDSIKVKDRRKSKGVGNNWYYQRVPSDKGFEFKPVKGGLGEDGPQHGFDTWVGGFKQYRDYLAEAGFGDLLKRIPSLGNHNDAPSGKEGTHTYSLLPEEHHVGAFLAKQTEKFVRSRAGNPQPWCAVLSFYGPHLPVAPPKPWDTMYSLDQVTLPPNHRDTLEGKPARQKNNAHCNMMSKWTDEQYKDYIRRYWGYCSFIDERIGQVFKSLRDTNQWDNTIIVFTTDHGDMVGAHGLIYKLHSCGYEELFHIPAIIRIPGLTKPGSRSDALVSNIDVLPTLLDASCIPRPDGIDGKSLVSLLRDETKRHREMVYSASMERSFICCDGRYKFVLNLQDDDLNELYDLKADPGEMRNLAYATEHKALAEKMSQQIITWLRETKHPYEDVIAAKVAGTTIATPPAEKR
jgi:arylsulfatase A-like enzyme